MVAAMSMKRSKEVRRRGRDNDENDGFFTPKPAAKQWDWEKDVSPQPDESFAQYAPQARFARDAFVLHPKFGKGVVIDVETSRVEVLFQDGPKKLAHGLA
jgi:hypothetical protein